MIIIGEKLNGSIPSVAKAIAERDADLIRERARMQAEAGATFLDVCASVEEAVEVETLKWMIDLVQEVTDTPICVDSPSARSCVAAIPFCKRPGLINSVSLEGDKIDTIFPVIADTDWECVALLCDNDGIPDSVERRMKIFFGIMFIIILNRRVTVWIFITICIGKTIMLKSKNLRKRHCQKNGILKEEMTIIS